MLRLGITGGIACGKTTVAEMLRVLEFDVIDADKLAHELIEPGQPAHQEILREFGASIKTVDATIDRAKLAAIVFADSAKLQRLNAIVHPRVEHEVFRQFEEWQVEGSRQAAFVEAALLVEAGLHSALDGVIVAWCTPQQQLDRLAARGLSREEARLRIARQMPVDEKLRFATEKIDCSGSLDETKRQVQELAEKIRSRRLLPAKKK